jgi:hypothetical protein
MSAIAELRAACTRVTDVFEHEVNLRPGLVVTVTRKSYDKMVEKIETESQGGRGGVSIRSGWFMIDGFKFVRGA